MSESRFCWHELMCEDPEAALRFYGGLLGWTHEEADMGGFPYRMLKNGEEYVGGLIGMTEKEKIPAHWMGYVNVDDVDAGCARVAELGGSVCVPPTDLPVGRFAVVNDPQGGVFSLWKGNEPLQPEPEKPAVGSFCWDECLSTDSEAGVGFYTELLGWTAKSENMGPPDAPLTYRLLYRGEKQIAGSMDLPPEAQAQGARTHWLAYVNVDDVDAGAAKAAELGGSVICPATDIPGVGRFCVVADPEGALLSLYKEAAK